MTESSLARANPPRDEQIDLQRRRWIYALVAGGASLAGLGLAGWNRRPNSKSGAPELALWDLSFEAPGKTSLRMQSLAGRPLLVNFWATWCPPCIEELPLLDRFYQENTRNGWHVLGLAVDQMSAVEAFLERAPVRFQIALAGMAGIELSRTLGNLSGGLPFTVVLGSAGQVLHRKIGPVSTQDLRLWSALR